MCLVVFHSTELEVIDCPKQTLQKVNEADDVFLNNILFAFLRPFAHSLLTVV